jgi:Xaa-Pro aminopeptidase
VEGYDGSDGKIKKHFYIHICMLQELLTKHKAQFFIQYASNKDANFYYATNLRILNATLHIVGRKREELVVPEMEKRRAERESSIREIISLSDLNFHDSLKEFRDPKKALAHTYAELLRSYGAKKILIPPNFPSFLSFYFREQFEVEIVENPFAKLRVIKSKEEIEKIRETSLAAIDGFNHLLPLLKKKLTCEELRNEVEIYLFSKGYLASHTIVASGTLTSDPHFMGKGGVEEHVLVDIFPKSRKHGYYSDFTRTVVVEKNREIEEMLEAVLEAMEKAMATIKDGIAARDVHNAVCDILEDKGYHTLRSKAKEGFIHSTGHGIGLEVHEEPRIFENDDRLKKGMVFSVEPGLYYKKWGGVRIEDVVVVTMHGCEVLTKYPRRVRLDG